MNEQDGRNEGRQASALCWDGQPKRREVKKKKGEEREKKKIKENKMQEQH